MSRNCCKLQLPTMLLLAERRAFEIRLLKRNEQKYQYCLVNIPDWYTILSLTRLDKSSVLARRSHL